MDGFTKEQTYEFLSAYPENTISMVLGRLGYDENTEEYPADIVEKAEKIYQTMGIAVETQKQLALNGGSNGDIQDVQITVRQTTAIAAEIMEAQGIDFPTEELFILAQGALQQGKEMGQSIQAIRKAAFIAEVRSGNAEFVKEIINVMSGNSSVIEEVFSSENMQAMIDAHVSPVAPVDIKGFRAQLDARQKAICQTNEAREQQRAALPRPKVDVKAFLAARNV